MAKQEQKYVDALATFTDSLDAIVQLLQNQKSNDTADVIIDFLKAPMNELVSVVKDLQKVTIQGFTKQENRNKIILEEIKSIKKQRESGMFENVEDPKNKNKIVDGIKVVILIAAGVLALGLAFKIIGKVDFLSVMALSGAMLLMSIAFSKMQNQKLDIMKVIKISAILPIMAVGLALSGFFLKNFPAFSLRQGLSILLIGGALGLATFFILKAIDKLSIRSLFMVPLVVLILPLIALGLVKSSIILKGVQSLSLMQVLSVGLVGIAIGVAMYAISFSMKHMKGITFPQVLMFTAMIPLIALGLVLASQILQDFQPINNPLGLLKGSVVIGLAVLAVSFSVVLIGRFLKGKEKDLAIGVIGAIAVAGAIVAISYIFKALPSELNAPDMMWSLKVGISLLIFSSIAVLIAVMMGATLSMEYDTGKGATGSIGGSIGGSMKTLGVGVLAVIAIAATIVIVSQIFRLFASDSPVVDPMWSLGVGLSILLLSAPVMLIGLLISTGVGGLAFGAGLLALPLIALSMIAVQAILGKGTWSSKKYPSKDFADGVGGLLESMAKAYAIVVKTEGFNKIINFFSDKSDNFTVFVENAAKTMVTTRDILSGVDWNSAKFPSKDYTESVGSFLISMADAYSKLNNRGFLGTIAAIFGSKQMSLEAFVVDSARALKLTSEIWSKSDFSKYPSEKYIDSFSYFVIAMSDLIRKNDFDLKDTKEFGMSINFIAHAFESLSNIKPMPSGILNGYTDFLNKFKNTTELKTLDQKSDSINKLANSFLALANSLSSVSKNLNGINDLSRGLFLISIIDDAKFGNVLKTVDKYKGTLQVINQVPSEQSNLLSTIKGLFDTVDKSKGSDSKVENKKSDIDTDTQKKFYKDVSDIRSMLYEFKELIDKPSQAGSFHK